MWHEKRYLRRTFKFDIYFAKLPSFPEALVQSPNDKTEKSCTFIRRLSGLAMPMVPSVYFVRPLRFAWRVFRLS